MLSYTTIAILALHLSNLLETESYTIFNNSCSKETARFKETFSNSIRNFGVAPSVVYTFTNDHWRTYKEKYQKVYSVEEDHSARHRYKKNIQKMNEHNAKYFNGSVTYALAPNKFTDQSTRFLNEHFSPITLPHLNFNQQITVPSCVPPSAFDYRERLEKTLNVLNKTSGSGWREAVKSAVSVLSSIKYQNQEISHHQLIDVIDQNKSCEAVETSYKCLDLYKQMARNGNFQNDNVEIDPVFCLPADKLHDDNVFADLSNDRLRKVVAYMSPVVVPFSPVSFEFLHYSHGVFTPPETSITKSYFLVVIGYGTENGTDYWILQNSFGPDWGEHGYMLVRMSTRVLCPISHSML